MKWAKAESVLNGVRTSVAMPVDMSSLESDRHAIQTRVQPADCTAIQVRSEYGLAECRITRSAPTHTNGLQVETDCGEQISMHRRRKVHPEHLVSDLCEKLGRSPKKVLDLFREATGRLS
jgi:hypothetical protein